MLIPHADRVPEGFRSVGLLPVANRALFCHALEALHRGGVRRAAVLADLPLLAELREAVDGEHASGPRLCWFENGSRDALSGLERFAAGEAVAVHLADSLSRSGLEPLLAAPTGARDATVLVRPGPPGVVNLARRRLEEGGASTAGESAGVWVLGSGLLGAACELAGNAGFEAGITAAVRGEGRLATIEVTDWWRYGRRPETVLEANRFALEGLTRRPTSATIIDTRLEAAVAIHSSARLESSLVRGPAVIGPSVVMRDCYVGPYSSIGRDCVIEGAELEHSVVLPGSVIRHLGARLESSVVGPRARITRDLRLPRALRMNLSAGADVSLA